MEAPRNCENSGEVVRIIVSQQEGCGFFPRAFLCRDSMLPLCLRFPPPSHQKGCRLDPLTPHFWVVRTPGPLSLHPRAQLCQTGIIPIQCFCLHFLFRNICIFYATANLSQSMWITFLFNYENHCHSRNPLRWLTALQLKATVLMKKASVIQQLLGKCARSFYSRKPNVLVKPTVSVSVRILRTKAHYFFMKRQMWISFLPL